MGAERVERGLLVHQLVCQAAEQLAAITAVPRLEAEVLLAHTMVTERGALLARTREAVPPDCQQRYWQLVDRRCGGEPLQYLTGKQEFWSLNLDVTPAVLIPRPDTEVIIEAALRLATPTGGKLVAIDVGTGSGAIALVMAECLPQAEVYAIDSSAAALTVAVGNARKLDLLNRIKFIHADLLQPWLNPASTLPSADLVLANLPYIPVGHLPSLPPDVQHEPRSALDGGPDGLAVIRRLLPQVPPVLREGGYLLLEVGMEQSCLVQDMLPPELAADSWVEADWEGRPRVVVARRESKSGIRIKESGQLQQDREPKQDKGKQDKGTVLVSEQVS